MLDLRANLDFDPNVLPLADNVDGTIAAARLVAPIVFLRVAEMRRRKKRLSERILLHAGALGAQYDPQAGDVLHFV